MCSCVTKPYILLIIAVNAATTNNNNDNDNECCHSCAPILCKILRTYNELFELIVFEVVAKQIIDNVIGVDTLYYSSSLLIRINRIPTGSWNVKIRPYFAYFNSKWCSMVANLYHSCIFIS